MGKTETQEIRAKQNLFLRGWIIKLVILFGAGCVLLTIVSTMGELGLTGKSSINLGFANIEVNSGESQKLNPNQQQQLEQKAREPVAQSFNTNNAAGYCSYEYGSYSFSLYPNVPYGPSYNGYYVTTSGGSQFGVLDPYGTFTGITAQTSGRWQNAIDGGDIEVCFDANGSYARFRY